MEPSPLLNKTVPQPRGRINLGKTGADIGRPEKEPFFALTRFFPNFRIETAGEGRSGADDLTLVGINNVIDGAIVD